MSNKTEAEASFLDSRVKVLVGDLTQQRVDAVVNAANSSLLGGGGVDGALHKAGGPAILEACREIRRTTFPKGLPTGEAVITTAGELPASYVIHTVGPVYGRDPQHHEDLLAACYANSLKLAAERSLGSIAFPSISTGAFGYPKPEAAAVSSSAIKSFLLQDSSILEVRLVFFSQKDARVFLEYQKF
jgi:O-acetyl-ADP-ribose deacetylase (regulator of RNase III)